MPDDEYIRTMLYVILICEAIVFLPIFYLLFIWPWVYMIKEWRGSKRPESGDSRAIEKFLWLPMIIDGERRWLTRTKIQQRYKAVVWEDIMGMPMHWDWVNVAWA